MHTEATVEIDLPIEEVFEYTIHNVAEWSPTVIEDEVIEAKPEGVGTRFRVVTGDRGQRMEFEGVVTRHEPPRAHSVRLEGKSFDIEADYAFEDAGKRTRVTERSTIRAKGFVRGMLVLFGWLMKRSGCKALERELANLKRILEERESPAAG